jgi:hypothetical protein
MRIDIHRDFERKCNTRFASFLVNLDAEERQIQMLAADGLSRSAAAARPILTWPVREAQRVPVDPTPLTPAIIGHIARMHQAGPYAYAVETGTAES